MQSNSSLRTKRKLADVYCPPAGQSLYYLPLNFDRSERVEAAQDSRAEDIGDSASHCSLLLSIDWNIWWTRALAKPSTP